SASLSALENFWGLRFARFCAGGRGHSANAYNPTAIVIDIAPRWDKFILGKAHVNSSLKSSARGGRLCVGSRREFLWQMGGGFAGLALTALLDADGFFTRNAGAATPEFDPMQPRSPHFVAKAKSCIFLFMYGGPSQMDMFD